MKWFKHFSNARKSEKVGLILETMGIKGYGQWFIILELLTEKIDSVENYTRDTEIRIRKREMRAALEVQRNTQVTKILKSLASCNVLCFTQDDFFVSVQCPILFDLQDKDSKYNRKRIVKESLATTLEKRREEKRREDNTLTTNEHDCTIYDDVIQSWNTICAGNKKLKHHRGSKPNTTKEFFELIKLTPELKKIESWNECFESVVNSEFLNGSNPDSSFVCTLSWLIDKHTIVDVLNGQYSANKSTTDVMNDFLEYRNGLKLEEQRA